ncbi:hypothetical protein PVAP13_9KG137300 [Panicum virgatum]|uniref:Uncharacterized protein n=1 Tax=Panicum virgatum TaxID=38727 RepID=A0A8T0NDM2_PANVG|nr:hypothetical protein PVAP13_9KG137300 [Panicum virgatum]
MVASGVRLGELRHAAMTQAAAGSRTGAPARRYGSRHLAYSLIEDQIGGGEASCASYGQMPHAVARIDGCWNRHPRVLHLTVRDVSYCSKSSLLHDTV